ncbi:hypothetical protein EV363DRAFT_1299093 [Boletus edulis]|nr:hypothetical protein EV363DRAFT_1299093 [Boletus edulis]
MDVAEAITVYPSGTVLLIFAPCVATLVEQFQFFTKQQLRVIMRAHGLSCTSRDTRSVLVNLLQTHPMCSCDARYLRFGLITCPRQNVMQIHLDDPHTIVTSQQRSRQRDACAHRAFRETVLSGADPENQVDEPSVAHFPIIPTADKKLDIIREWQERMSRACLEESACAVCRCVLAVGNRWRHILLDNLGTVVMAVMCLRRVRNGLIKATLLFSLKIPGLYAIFNPRVWTTKPSVETLKQFAPVLVRKSKVVQMIDFLVNNNEWYCAGGVEHVGGTTGVGEEDSEEWIALQNDILMDNVAYTLGDHSLHTRESMKAHALAYALDRGGFTLHPWGIGGFHHPRQTPQQ